VESEKKDFSDQVENLVKVLETIGKEKQELGDKAKEAQTLYLAVENLTNELHHVNRGSERIQREYEKLKDILENERQDHAQEKLELRQKYEQAKIDFGMCSEKLQTAITSGSRKIEDLRAQAGEIQSQRDLIFQKLREAENKLMEVSKKLQEGRGREQMYNERLIHLRSTTAPLDKYQQCVRLCTELEKDLADFQIENKGLNTTVENLRHELRDVRLNSVSLKEYDECARKAESGHQTIRQLQQDLSENRAELERLASSCQSAKIAVIKAQTEIDHSRMNEQQLQHTIQSLESRNEKLNTENRQLHTTSKL